MTETTPTTPDAEELAALARLPKKDRDALAALDDEGRAALAELVAAGADPEPAEVELVGDGAPEVVEGEPAEVKPKGRGMARPVGGTVTDRARRAAEVEAPAEVAPAEEPAAPVE